MSNTGTINWDLVHQKLGESHQKLEASFTLSDEAVEAILTQRAELLANRKPPMEDFFSTRSVLLIQVGPHLAGIEIQEIQEVLRITSFARVPDAHESVLGVIIAHNQWVNLVSPYPLLNTAPPDSSDFTHAVMLKHAHLRAAIGCHGVLQLEEIPKASWESDNLFRFGGQLGTLLDIDNLLSPWEKELHLNHT